MYFSGVKKAAKDPVMDYKKLYEESLLTISEKEESLIKKDQQIIQLSFELDKFRKYLFGTKSEKLSSNQVDVSQMNLFDLGTTEQQQEELSEQIDLAPTEKKTPKKRATGF